MFESCRAHHHSKALSQPERPINPRFDNDQKFLVDRDRCAPAWFGRPVSAVAAPHREFHSTKARQATGCWHNISKTLFIETRTRSARTWTICASLGTAPITK